MQKVIGKVAIGVTLALVALLVAQRSATGSTTDDVRVIDVGVATDYAGALEGAHDDFIDLSGATYSVAAVRNGLLLISFAAESRCTGTKPGYCAVRILVDGEEPSPVAEPGTYFDSPGNAGWQSRATELSVQRVSKGLHTVAVQWGAFGSADAFKLGTWHLTVQSMK